MGKGEDRNRWWSSPSIQKLVIRPFYVANTQKVRMDRTFHNSTFVVDPIEIIQ